MISESYLLLTWVSGALTWDNMPGMLTLFLCRYFRKTSALRLANVQACSKGNINAQVRACRQISLDFSDWNGFSDLKKSFFLLQMFADHRCDVIWLTVWAQFISPTTPVLLPLVLLLQTFQHTAHLRHTPQQILMLAQLLGTVIVILPPFFKGLSDTSIVFICCGFR